MYYAQTRQISPSLRLIQLLRPKLGCEIALPCLHEPTDTIRSATRSMHPLSTVRPSQSRTIYQRSISVSLSSPVFGMLSTLSPRICGSQTYGSLGGENQPNILQDRTWLSNLRAHTGPNMTSRVFVQPESINLTLTAAIANTSIAALLSTAGMVQRLGHNWTQPTQLISRDFTSFYAGRLTTSH